MLVGHFDQCQGAVCDSSHDMVEIGRDDYAVFCQLWPSTSRHPICKLVEVTQNIILPATVHVESGVQSCRP